MPAYVADSPVAYRSLGLERRPIKPWEDGIRTDPNDVSYEWWYFDAHLEDGSTLVIAFHTKYLLTPQQPLTPMLEIDLDRPDGTSIKRMLTFAAGEFSASTEHCSVRIGPNTCDGDLDTYRLHIEDEQLVADVTLTRVGASWRPETGHMYFGGFDGSAEKLFGWLPAVPYGEVEATLTIGQTTETLHGTGYHDHNWGDAPMNELMHHWWWARAKVGPYTVISSYIVAEGTYGGDAVPVFMLARDGEIIADDAKRVTFSTDGAYVDESTGKPTAQRQVYDYLGSEGHYRVTWQRENDIASRNFVDELPDEQREAARAAGLNPSYLRFTGTATVESLDGETVLETFSAPAIWEMMYFGQVR